jgi:hypothetical protein
MPNLSEPIELEGFILWRSGEYAVFDSFSRIFFSGIYLEAGDEILPIDELLDSYYLPELNATDMERMDYGLRFQTILNPIPRFPRFVLEPTFTGKAWLLTGPAMGSAATLSAWLAKESGFATLVGETTGGAMGGARTIDVLPNTGIAFIFDMFYVTDSRGRPLEAGVVPHYFNRRGMTALQTVLAMIAEGEE